MQISFYCSCGESLSAPKSLRGRRAFCLICRRSVPVPAQIVRAHHMDLAGIPGVNEGTTGVMPAVRSYRIDVEKPASGDTTLNAPVIADDPDSVPLKERIKAELQSKAKMQAVAAAPPSSTAETVRKPSSTTGPMAPPRNGKTGEHTIDIQAPVKTELVRAADGREQWKLTCACGKRVLSPLKSTQPYGRCPKCGQRLPLPGYDIPRVSADNILQGGKPQVTRVSAVNVPPPLTVKRIGEPLPASVADVREDRTTTFAAAAPRQTDSNPSFDASVKAADRLRPSRGTMEALPRSVSGRISAWPLAGVMRRLLAEFIDITIALATAGAVLAWHMNEQGGESDPISLLLSTMLLVLWFNDGIIPLIWSGSVGKLLIVTVVHTEDGAPPGILRTMVRATLKWALIPGWLIGAFDAQQRTLHDLLCGTTVLKSRRRNPAAVKPAVPSAPGASEG